MASTTFTSGTVVASSWLNDVNNATYNKLNGYINAKEYGVVGDGITNDTTALQVFFTACMTGKKGYLGAGTYSVDEGILTIQPTTNVHTSGPYIETAGYYKTIFKPRGTTNAPILTIQNLTQSSGAGKFLKGGYLGSMGFDGTAQPGGWTASHAISLRGCDGWTFGFMNGESLRGSLLYIPQNLYGGNNPDPYHVAFCLFNGLQSNFGNGWVLENNNFVGFTSNEVFNIACYGSSTGFGAVKTCGAGNIYKKVSVGTCYGYAIDIYDGSAGGRSSREEFQILELDDPQYGIRVINQDQGRITQCRIVHRFHSGDSYWPKVALNISNGSNAQVSNSLFDITHRIEAGGVKANLGKFLEANNSTGITGVTVNYRINDNAGFGLTNADYITGVNIATSATLTYRTSSPVDNSVLYDSRYVTGFAAKATGTVNILNSGFGTAGNKLDMVSSIYNPRGDYNTTTSTYTVPVTGVYKVSGTIHVNGIGAGFRVRLGIYNGTSMIIQQEGYVGGAGRNGYSFTGVLSLTRGDTLTLNADQNSGANSTLNIAGVDNHWEVFLLQDSGTS
jgi:hypothetical protein